jgi:hypothetical protein
MADTAVISYQQSTLPKDYGHFLQRSMLQFGGPFLAKGATKRSSRYLIRFSRDNNRGDFQSISQPNDSF